jgi:cytoskeletal protein CcmA (bactofilin family)
MFGKKSRKPSNRIDSLIGAGTRVIGDVYFRGGLRVDGEVIGNVRAEGDESSTLVLSEHARIEGAVTVTHAVINGSIRDPCRVDGVSGTAAGGTRCRRRCL